MPKGGRANLERLLRSAWERQVVLQSMSSRKASPRHQKTWPNWDRVFAVVAMILSVLFFIYLRDRNSLVLACFVLCAGLIWIALHFLKEFTNKKSILGGAVFACMVISAFVGYTQRPEIPKPLVFRAFESLNHLNGADVAGIVWDAKYHDVRLTINNDNNYPVKDLELVIKVDRVTDVLGGVGQLNDIPGISFSALPWMPDYPLKLPGTNQTLSVNDYKFSSSPSWSMSCTTLPGNTQLRLVLEAIHGPDGSAPAKITLSGSYQSISRDTDQHVPIEEQVIDVRP
jgi:hypothetical protein